MQQASVKGCRCWKTGFSAGLKLPYVGYDDHWLSDPMCNRKPPSAEISKRSGIAGKTHSVNPLNLMFIRLGFQVSGVLGFWALRADPMLSCSIREPGGNKWDRVGIAHKSGNVEPSSSWNYYDCDPKILVSRSGVDFPRSSSPQHAHLKTPESL